MANLTHLQRAYLTLSEKRKLYDVLWKYYDGDHPLKYSTAKLREVFKDIDAHFTENWIEVIVNAANDRLDLLSIFAEGDKGLTEAIERIVEDNELTVQADALHLDILVTGEGNLHIWSEGVGQPCEITYNDARLVHVFYDPSSPRKPLFAAKWWEDIMTGKSRMTLYYPDRIEYYESTKSVSEMTGPDAWKSYQPMPQSTVIGPDGKPSAEAKNPFGVVPIIQFRRELRTIKGEISQSIIDLQDAVNKLMNDMMVTSESAAFKQRYVISNAEGIDKLKSGPGKVWDIPASDGLEQSTEVGQFAETPLTNFLTSMEKKAASMGKISRTPLSYFDLGARADPSGESLIAMESPLNKKVGKYIKGFRGPWRRVISMALKMENRALARVGLIKVAYDKPETVQPLTQAQARQANTTAGIPLKTSLRYEGWSSKELAELEADKRAEAEQAANSVAEAVLAQERIRSMEDPDAG